MRKMRPTRERYTMMILSGKFWNHFPLFTGSWSKDRKLYTQMFGSRVLNKQLKAEVCDASKDASSTGA